MSCARRVNTERKERLDDTWPIMVPWTVPEVISDIFICNHMVHQLYTCHFGVTHRFIVCSSMKVLTVRMTKTTVELMEWTIFLTCYVCVP